MMENQLNSNSMRTCLLAALLFSGIPAHAEETQSVTSSEQGPIKDSSVAEPGNAEEEPNSGTVEESGQETEEASLAETPQAENLKNRNLGAAFRSFRPSEEISADNAVPYPVDI